MNCYISNRFWCPSVICSHQQQQHKAVTLELVVCCVQWAGLVTRVSRWAPSLRAQQLIGSFLLSLILTRTHPHSRCVLMCPSPCYIIKWCIEATKLVAVSHNVCSAVQQLAYGCIIESFREINPLFSVTDSCCIYQGNRGKGALKERICILFAPLPFFKHSCDSCWSSL